MSKIRLTGRKRAGEVNASPISKILTKNAVATYIFFMFAIYPLYYEDKYYNMGDAKYHFFRWVTLIGLIIIAALFAWYQVHLFRKGVVPGLDTLKQTSLLDRFVLAYTILTLLSFLLSPYKDYTLKGYEGWYMGLISQMAFVLLYYFASRFFRWDEIVLTIYLGISAIVFLICVLNRFYVDPLEMYVGLDQSYIINFVSTLGQATWFSSYLVLLFPIGLFTFWNYDHRVVRILSGIYVFLGSMTMIAQNSDSAIMAYAFMYLGLFCYSFRDNLKMRRFLECLVLLFAGWKAMGILQVVFSEKAVVLSGTMRGMSIGLPAWILLAVSVAMLLLYIRVSSSDSFEIANFKAVRTVVLGLVVVSILGIVVYIALNTTGALAGTPLASDSNYLLFDEFWGNNRGSSWMVAVGTFAQSDIVRKLFGAGPDGFYNQAYTYYADVLAAKWGENTVLTCAHNEWLNALITSGLLGAAAYMGIFIGGIVRFTKKSAEVPEVIAPALCIIAYMAHNFFCYQQIICTPCIFLIIGAGESLCRYGRWPIWEPDGE